MKHSVWGTQPRIHRTYDPENSRRDWDSQDLNCCSKDQYIIWIPPYRQVYSILKKDVSKFCLLSGLKQDIWNLRNEFDCLRDQDEWGLELKVKTWRSFWLQNYWFYCEINPIDWWSYSKLNPWLRCWLNHHQSNFQEDWGILMIM